MKNKIDVLSASVAPELIGDYIRDFGYDGEDHVFIKRVGHHLEIGGVTFRCIK
jgi:hypothetical protein